jgi:hypothetical protein
MAIYDTMNFLQCDIVTYCIGMAASMSTVLLGCRHQGQALRAAEQPGDDSPAERRRGRPSGRHRDRGAGNPPLDARP